MTEPISNIIFNAPSPHEEVIRLDKDGFHYKGQFIADAGEAHRLMVEFLKQNTKTKAEPPTDEELIRAAEESDFVYEDDGRLFNSYTECSDIKTEVLSFARAVLERWGNG